MQPNLLTKIENYKSLCELISSQKAHLDTKLIDKAYKFAKEAHYGQTRISGETYEAHFLNVASIVVQLGLDTTSVVAALLHDVVEKANVDIDKIDKIFGTEVAFIVDGLTQIRKATEQKDVEDENFKHFLLSTTEDIRILIIRIAEKTDNVINLGKVPEDVRVKAAKKIMNLYSPLAEYLGLGYLQKVMEDAAFKALYPDIYSKIMLLSEKFFSRSQDTIDQFLQQIGVILKKYSIQPLELQGRKKGMWSTYKKLKNRYLKQGEEVNEETFSRLKDLFAARVILNSIEECYTVLGLIHSNFAFLQNDFDDYIANPKENGYRSIQTIVSFEGFYFEVQIRTKEMHDYNEFGPASHIAYKLNGPVNAGNTLTWTRDLVKWKKNSGVTKEDFKIKLFANSIFVFTPKGLLIRLEKGSTPIDFAFRIHSDIGEHYTGARVNNKMVNKEHLLLTGDTVEIIISPKPTVNESWLLSVKSATTKAKIRKLLSRKNLGETLIK